MGLWRRGWLLLAVEAGHLTVSAVGIIQVVGLREQLNHVARPRLALLLSYVGRFAQVVLVAQVGLASPGFAG